MFAEFRMRVLQFEEPVTVTLYRLEVRYAIEALERGVISHFGLKPALRREAKALKAALQQRLDAGQGRVMITDAETVLLLLALRHYRERVEGRGGFSIAIAEMFTRLSCLYSSAVNAYWTRPARCLRSVRAFGRYVWHACTTGATVDRLMVGACWGSAFGVLLAGTAAGGWCFPAACVYAFLAAMAAVWVDTSRGEVVE